MRIGYFDMLKSTTGKTFEYLDTVSLNGTLRILGILIEDGTNVNTVKATVYNIFNGDSIAAVDNIGKGTTVGAFSLSADGVELTILNDGITGNVVGVLPAAISGNNSGAVLYGIQARANSFNIIISASSSVDGALFDLTTIKATTGYLQINIAYITNV